MTDKTKDSLFEFPCEYPVKVVGKQHSGETESDFEKEVLAIFNNHFSELKEGAVTRRTSKDNTYLALTITVTAESKAQLDALYRELSAHHLVVWVL